MLRNPLNQWYSRGPSTAIESDIRVRKLRLQPPYLQGLLRGLFWTYGRSPKKPTVGRRDDPR